VPRVIVIGEKGPRVGRNLFKNINDNIIVEDASESVVSLSKMPT